MSMSLSNFKACVLAPLVVAVSACATIVGDPTQTIPIASTPSGAKVTIVDETGAAVFRGNTPTSVTLQKSDGSYWGKKNYTVMVEKKGFEPQKIPVTASANGWYLAGNALFGGLIGWFAVDPMGGHMYKLSPEAVAATMGEKAAHNNTSKDGGISIVLIEEVPEALRAQLVRLD